MLDNSIDSIGVASMILRGSGPADPGFVPKNRHKQYPVNLGGKVIHTDDAMRPIVRFMNSLSGVQTIYSCKGHGKAKYNPKAKLPYLMFRAKDSKILEKILEACYIREPGNKNYFLCEDMNVDYYDGTIRYTLRWVCKEAMRTWLTQLKGSLINGTIRDQYCDESLSEAC